MKMKKMTSVLLAVLMLLLLTAGVGISLNLDLSADVLDMPESIVELENGVAQIPAYEDFPAGTFTLADAYFNGDVLLLGWKLDYQYNSVIREDASRLRHTDKNGEKSLAWYPEMQDAATPWYASRYRLGAGQLVWGNQHWEENELLENTSYMWTPGQEVEMAAPVYMWDEDERPVGPGYHLYQIHDHEMRKADEIVVYLPIERYESHIARFDGEGYFTMERNDHEEKSVFVKIVVPRT